MTKRLFFILSTLLIITWSAAACSSGMKMVKRDLSGTATLTPFLPKATFTSINTPVKINGGTDTNNISLTMTIDPALMEETSEVTITGQVSSMPSQTLTPSETPLWVSASLTPVTPSVTLNIPLATSTPEPSPTMSTSAGTSGIPTTLAPSATLTPPATLIPSATSANTPPPEPTNTSAPSVTPPPAGCTFSGNATYENQVIVLINQERTNRGLSPLALNSSLRSAARRHSEDMACNDFFSHTGSDGSTLSSRLLAAGYNYSWAAENIAASSSSSFSASAVVSMWMNSSGHKANILSENAVHIGVGFRYAGDSVSQDFDAYYTADFGRP